MRVVADTNTVVSGLLWYGTPREVLDAARSGKIELFTTSILLAELEDVLGRFSKRLELAGATPLGPRLCGSWKISNAAKNNTGDR